MAIIHVVGQSGRNATAYQASLVVNMALVPVEGNILVAVIGGYTNYNEVTSILQTGVTWTKQSPPSTNTRTSVEIWVGVVGFGASPTMTVNLPTNWNFVIADVYEYTITTPVLDKTATANGSGTTTNTGITPMTTQAEELCIGAIVNGDYDSQATQSAPTNGFTLYDGIASGGSLAFLEYISSTIGVFSSGTTLSQAENWAGCMITLMDMGIAKPKGSITIHAKLAGMP